MFQAQPETSVSSESIPQAIDRPPFVVADDEVEYALFAPQLRIPKPEEASRKPRTKALFGWLFSF